MVGENEVEDDGGVFDGDEVVRDIGGESEELVGREFVGVVVYVDTDDAGADEDGDDAFEFVGRQAVARAECEDGDGGAIVPVEGGLGVFASGFSELCVEVLGVPVEIDDIDGACESILGAW